MILVTLDFGDHHFGGFPVDRVPRAFRDQRERGIIEDLVDAPDLSAEGFGGPTHRGAE